MSLTTSSNTKDSRGQVETYCKFDDALLGVIKAAEFKVVAVVIDKQELRRAYGSAAGHPYHLGLGFLLQRFAGYLNHINRVGDILGEARGGREDRLLKESYARVFERGRMGDEERGVPIRPHLVRIEVEA
jgi:hypothetical protein